MSSSSSQGTVSGRDGRLTEPHILSATLAVLTGGQAVLGLAFPHLYRDTGFVRETWFGNDWVTLVLGVPLVTTGLLLERRGSVHGRLLWLGALGYGVYTGPTRFWPSSGRARTHRSPRRTADPSDARGSCPDHRRRQPARRPGSDAAGRGRA